MRKLSFLLLPSVLFSLTMMLVSCGGSDSPKPIPQQQLNFAYLTEAPAGAGGPYQPVLGNIKGTVFTATPVKDPGTGNAIAAEFNSVILSFDGKKGVVDMRTAESGAWDIAVGVVNGSQAISITNDSYYDAYPTFTSNNSKVIFLSSRGTSSGWDTMMANADGSGALTNLTADSPICHHEPSMAPNGNTIAFSGHGHDAETGFYDVYVMDASGQNPVNLTKSTNYDIESRFPSFSPDGKLITFTRVDFTVSPAVMDIYVMNADGSNPKKLSISGQAVMSRFLADGTITFMQYQTNNWEIFRMNADGSNPTRLTNNTVYDGFTTEFMEWGSGSVRPARILHHR